ncbi:MAG: class I SAM-dependent methyltransferase [Candidatus Gottesmanbacteria bacterium]|nr:class I SAM-dependent methyltransferase [Candidatus Gottesmanbacteria bacterium]
MNIEIKQHKQKKWLDAISLTYSSRMGFHGITTRYQFTVCKQYFTGVRVLDLGCADGESTAILANYFKHVVAIDGSHVALERLKKYVRDPNIRIINGLFEQVSLDDQFDTIFVGHTLEHVEHPVVILNKYAKNLAPHGRMIITVPNALSIHRLAAVSMGILKSPYEVTKQDISLGHRRVYDRTILHHDIKRAGLHVYADDGYWLKPLSNAQIAHQWSAKQLRVFMELGRNFLNNCAELVVVCTK